MSTVGKGVGSLQCLLELLGVHKRNYKPKEKFKEFIRAMYSGLVLQAKVQRIEIMLREMAILQFILYIRIIEEDLRKVT